MFRACAVLLALASAVAVAEEATATAAAASDWSGDASSARPNQSAAAAAVAVAGVGVEWVEQGEDLAPVRITSSTLAPRVDDNDNAVSNRGFCNVPLNPKP